jgi:drug/metabolite transporter (DMT)-like permease
MSDSMRGRLRTPLLYVSVVAFWGSSFLWVGIATPTTSPFVVAIVRLVVGSMVVGAVLAALPRSTRAQHRPAALRPWLGRGILLALSATVIPSLLLALAQREIASGTAAIINATAPLFAAATAGLSIGAHPAERGTRLQIAGLLIGLLGVGVLVGETPNAAELRGELLVVVMAAVYGAGAVLAQRSFGDAPPYAAAIMVTVVAAGLVLPFGIAGWIADPPDLGGFLALVALGVLSSGLAYLCYYELIRTLGATRTLTVTYLAPAVAILLGVAVLGERVRLLHLAGLALILLGVAAVNGQLPRRRSPAR